MYDVERLTRLKSYELGGMKDLAAPVQVWPCRHCASWHVEVYRRDDGELALRDWHDDACQHLRALQSDDEVDAARG